MKLSAKTIALVGLAALAYYVYTQNKKNAALVAANAPAAGANPNDSTSSILKWLTGTPTGDFNVAGNAVYDVVGTVLPSGAMRDMIR